MATAGHSKISNSDVMPVLVVYPGSQREIFPGGMKVDNGSPNLFGHQTCAKFFDLYFCLKLGEIKNKKRSLLKFSPIFCSKLGKVHKKKVFTEI